MLRRQELQRAQQLEQQRYDDQRFDQTLTQNQSIAQQSEAAKSAEFDRKLKVAELFGKSSGRLGIAQPTGFEGPPVQEQSDAAYLSGMADRAERAVPRMLTYDQQLALELEKSRRAADTSRTQLLGKTIGLDESKYGHIGSGLASGQEAALTEAFPGSTGPVRTRSSLGELTAGSAKNLTTEFRKELSKYPNVQDYYKAKSQLTAIQTAANDGAGDLTIIMGFARMTQPGTRGVTDADFVNFASAGGAGARIQSYVTYWIENKRLPGEIRQQMQSEAERHFESKKAAAKEDAEWFEKGILPTDVPVGSVIHPSLREPAPGQLSPEAQRIFEMFKNSP